MNFKALYSVEEIKTITKLHYLWTQLIYFYASNSRGYIYFNLFISVFGFLGGRLTKYAITMSLNLETTLTQSLLQTGNMNGSK